MRVKIAVILCMLFFMTGCNNTGKPLDRALSLRKQIIESNGCSFHTTVTADYGEKIYVFSIDCITDKEGNLTFTVTEPGTIAGITGNISSVGGALTFDDQVLAFQTMADDRVTPVTAPWLLMKSLQSGYIKGCANTDAGIEIFLDDSYAEDALHLQIVTKGDVPVSAEIFYTGRRVLTLTVENFTYL